MLDVEELRLKFRDSMASLAAHVNIITSNGPAGKCGITATAVCSITDTPPTVLVCVNKNSQMNSVFQGNKTMCINVLASEHEDISCHFAGMKGSTMEERFALDIWDYGQIEQPMLKDAVCNLEGQIAKIEEYGTHYLYFVQIQNINIKDKGGLIYFKRKFRQVPL